MNVAGFMESSALQACQGKGCLYLREILGRKNSHSSGWWVQGMMLFTGASVKGTGCCKTREYNPGWDMTPVNPWESGASSLAFDFSSYPSLPLLFHDKFFNTSLWRASTFVAVCRSDLIDTMKKSI